MSPLPALLAAGAPLADLLRELAVQVWEDHRQELLYAVAAIAWATVRAAGRTVQSGNTGLKFSFGRAVRVVEPGFHLLVPFLQVIRTLPTRSRTLDLPSQRVTTLDGLVYDVDANLVYRVVDVRKALIEIDELERGMLQVLGLAVQEVLRARGRAELYASAALDGELSGLMAARLAMWGVEVERAGFPTIHPSRETVRVTQLAALGAERRGALSRLRASGTSETSGLALLGLPTRVLTRTQLLAERSLGVRRRRRLVRLRRRLEHEDRVARAAARQGREGFFTRRARLARERRARRAAEGSLVG